MRLMRPCRVAFESFSRTGCRLASPTMRRQCTTPRKARWPTLAGAHRWGKDVDMAIDAEGFPVMDEMEFSDPSPPKAPPPRTEGTFLNPKTRKVAVVDRRQGQPKATSATKAKASAKNKGEWSTICLIRPRASGPTKEANPRWELCALDQATGKRTHVATLHEKGHGPTFAEIGLKLKLRLEEAERDGKPMTKEDAKKLLASFLVASGK